MEAWEYTKECLIILLYPKDFKSEFRCPRYCDLFKKVLKYKFLVSWNLPEEILIIKLIKIPLKCYRLYSPNPITNLPFSLQNIILLFGY